MSTLICLFHQRSVSEECLKEQTVKTKLIQVLLHQVGAKCVRVPKLLQWWDKALREEMHIIINRIFTLVLVQSTQDLSWKFRVL